MRGNWRITKFSKTQRSPISPSCITLLQSMIQSQESCPNNLGPSYGYGVFCPRYIWCICYNRLLSAFAFMCFSALIQRLVSCFFSQSFSAIAICFLCWVLSCTFALHVSCDGLVFVASQATPFLSYHGFYIDLI